MVTANRIYDGGVEVLDQWIGERRVHRIGDGWFDHGATSTNSSIWIPDAANLHPTDLDIRWYGIADWANATLGFFSQWTVTGNNCAWLMESGSNQVRLSASTNGSTQLVTGLVTFPYSAGQPGGIRFTRRQSDGLTTLYWSNDGITWTPYTTTTWTVAAATALFAATTALRISGYNGGTTSPLRGKTIYAELRNGIDGPVVYRVGPETWRRKNRWQSPFTAETGQTVTRSSAATTHWIYPSVYRDDLVGVYKGGTMKWPGGDGYLSLYNTSGNYLNTGPSTVFDADLMTTSGFTLVAKVRRHGTTWTPFTLCNHLSSYMIDVNVDGWGGTAMVQRLTWDYNNHANWTWAYGAALPETNGWLWLAVTYIGNNGGNWECRFWTSLDGLTWTLMRSATTGPATNVMSGKVDSGLEVGANPWAPNFSDIDLGYFSVRAGTGAGGTVGGTEKFKIDRSTFKADVRATTLSATPITFTVQRSSAAGRVLTIIPTIDMPMKWDNFQWDDGSQWV